MYLVTVKNNNDMSQVHIYLKQKHTTQYVNNLMLLTYFIDICFFFFQIFLQNISENANDVLGSVAKIRSAGLPEPNSYFGLSCTAQYYISKQCVSFKVQVNKSTWNL